MNSSILPINGTVKSTTAQGQTGPGNYANEGVIHIP